MPELQDTRPGASLIRGIGAAGIALIIVNGMIGAGIFALPEAVATRAGLLSPWLFVLIGCLFITVVLSFAELSSYFDNTGGPVLYTSSAFGAPVGFCTGWSLYVSRMTAYAANVTAMALYVAAFWPWIATTAGRNVFIVAVVAGLTIANYIGVRDSIRTLAALTLLKLVPILLLILLGMKEVTGDILLPASFPGVDDVGGLTLLIIYAFVGFEAATFVSGETREPRRILPRTLIATVVATALLYSLIMLVFVSVIDVSEADGKTLVDVGRRLAGEPGALVIGLAAVFSIGGNLSANMLSAPRLTFALGEQRLLPAWFAEVHPRFSTPGNSILLLSSLALVFALSGSFELLAMASSLTRLIAYVLCIASIPIIRRQVSDEVRSQAYRLPGALFIPLVALSLCVWIASHSPLRGWLMTGLLFAIGLALFWLAQKALIRATPET